MEQNYGRDKIHKYSAENTDKDGAETDCNDAKACKRYYPFF